MYNIEDLLENENKVSVGDGFWVSARPHPPCFYIRLKDAWGVLIGKLDAIKWPYNQ